MENDIPKIDLPQDWVIGKLSEKDIGLLNLYANYPCRLKAGIFVLCLRGEVEASINLTQFKVEAGSFITILPGTIFQIHRMERDMHYAIKDSPVFKLKEEAQSLLRDYFELLIKTYQFCVSQLNRSLINHLFSGILMGVSIMYKDKTTDTSNLSKAEIISKNFTQLVMQNYTMQRSVAWYAKRLGITQAHLSSIIKQTTGKTCIEIITSMVIMDAKAQLKSTNLSIHDIAYTLNFTNMSFFGKYFKRYVGMSPQEYRNS